MAIFVDTSVFYACLDADDKDHELAVQSWDRLQEGDDELVSSNYVLVETVALVANR